VTNNVQQWWIRTLISLSISLPFLFLAWKIIVHEGLNPQIRYGLFACVITVCLLILALPFFNSATRRKVLLALFSSVISIYGVETVLTVAYHSEWTGQRELERHVAKNNPLTKLQKIQSLRDKGVIAVPAVPAGDQWGDGYILGGISNAFVVFCDETGEWATYQSDEFGFNNPLGTHVRGVDAVLVGDSFTEGACVNAEYNVASRLRIENWNVVNLGKAGTGPLMQLATLVEYGEELQPSFVIWLFYEGNDLKDLLAESRDKPLLRRYLVEGYSLGLKSQQREISTFIKDLLETKLIEEIRRAGSSNPSNRLKRHRAFDSIDHTRETLYDFATLRFLRNLVSESFIDRHRPSYLDGALPKLREVLEVAKLRIESWGGEMIFVYLPQWSRYKWEFETDDATKKRDMVMTIVREVGLTVIDFDKVLRSKEQPLQAFPFGMAGHYNAIGYELLAKQINDELRQSAK